MFLSMYDRRNHCLNKLLMFSFTRGIKRDSVSKYGSRRLLKYVRHGFTIMK